MAAPSEMEIFEQLLSIEKQAGGAAIQPAIASQSPLKPSSIVKARDAKNKGVLVRHYENVFSISLHGAQCLARELKLMRVLDHEFIAKLHDISPISWNEFDCFNTLRMATRDAATMEGILAAKNTNYTRAPGADGHLLMFMGMAFCGLAYLHAQGCIHGNIKPSNLIITPDNAHTLYITGFDEARIEGCTEFEPEVTGGESRQMAAPEVLCDGRVSKAADVFSMGLVLFAIFEPDADVLKEPLTFDTQLYTYLEAFVPTAAQLNAIINDTVRRKALQIAEGLASMESHQPFIQRHNLTNEEYKPLLISLLAWDPTTRPSAEDVLRTPVFTEQGFDEMVPAPPARKLDPRDFAHGEESLPRLRRMIFREMELFHPELMPGEWRRETHSSHSWPSFRAAVRAVLSLRHTPTTAIDHHTRALSTAALGVLWVELPIEVVEHVIRCWWELETRLS